MGDKRKNANRYVSRGDNDFETRFPEIAKEWDYKRNYPLTPSDVSYGSKELRYWICPVCNNSYDMRPLSRSHGSNCPYCANQRLLVGFNDLASADPILAMDWDYERNNGKRPEEYLISCREPKVNWICRVCGHQWTQTIKARHAGRGCPRCNNRRKTSFPEQVLFYYIKNAYSDTINRYTEMFEDMMEIDVYIPSLCVGIEYDGDPWHTSKESLIREKRKYELCKKNGISLIRVRECDLESTESIADEVIKISGHPMAKELDGILYQLKLFLPLLNNIDVARDKNSILESYYTELRNNSFGAVYPEKALDWDQEGNGNLTPLMFSKSSNEKVHWRCHICSGKWEDTINSYVKGKCPYCIEKKVLLGVNDLKKQPLIWRQNGIMKRMIP